jgi:hypothetical protein
MGFFRSSESKSKSSKSKSRFSFRRQSEEGADTSPPTKASAPLSPPAPTRTRTASPRSHPPAPSSSAFASTAASGLRGTIVSSASTSSASSSISSPTALQRAANDSDLETPKPSATTSSSVASAKRTSDSQASTDTEDAADFMRTPSESSILATPRGSFDTHENAGPMSMEQSRPANASRKDSSDYTSARASTMVASRHSLVGYKKLQCSMSYKNRMAQGAGGDDPLLSTPSAGASSISLRASFNTGGRRSESSRSSSSRVSRGSGSYFSNSRENSALSHIDEHSAAAPPPSSPSSHPRSSVEEALPSEPADEADNESATASSSMLLNRRMSELRLNEASVTALQTRRAFQQMVLAMEDEDGSSDDDSDDDTTSFQRPSSSLGRVVSLGVDDYRKFQFRLRQLEELTAEQARKQANIEQTIEQEVTQRTSKVVEAMEKKIAMYKQAKDLEVEREIQRRLSIEGGRMTTAGSARESSFYGGQMNMLGTPPPLAPGGDLKGKPLEKLFHPRRTRRRMELLREREEQQKKEMEQFREFIRVTEMRATNSDFSMTPMASARQNSEVVVAETARASIKALRDPHITEDLLTATPNELIEMICVLRKHVSVQETQLDQAKRLISAAIEAREEAEETAREAVELTMELDTRLERASQEIVVIKDELRRSSDFSMRSSYLFKSLDSNSQVSVSAPLTATETNGILPRTASFPNL